MTYYSVDDGETVAPGLLPAVLRAMRASFQGEAILDAFASPDAPIYCFAVAFRFGVPVRFDGDPRRVIAEAFAARRTRSGGAS